MTREQRRQRRVRVFCIICAAALIAELVLLAIGIMRLNEREEEHNTYDPPYQPVTVIKAEIERRTDYPKHYYRQDVPLDRYQQETLYNAAKEWNVPYELALAVCFAETEYQNLETTVVQDDGTVRHYYGMMAVQLERAGSYMEKCGVEYLNSEEDRLRVGCCILGEHINNYGITRGLMAYNAGADTAKSQWTVGVEQTAYTITVLDKMEELMG